MAPRQARLFQRSARRRPRAQAPRARAAELYQLKPAPTAKELDVRSRVGALIARGVQQKALAAQMGVSESWLSRWLHDGSVSPLTVGAMERFEAYAAELAKLGRAGAR